MSVGSNNTSSSLLKIVMISVVTVSTILGLIIYFDLDALIFDLLEWFVAQGVWAPVLFILLMAFVVIFVLPGFLLTTGAGFVFGVVEGSLYVVLGTTIGASISFLIARNFFGERAEKYLAAHIKLKLMDDRFTPVGWKVVLLSRLIPFFPSKLANYFFGLTHFSLAHYIFGTLIGIIPFSIYSVYLGSIAAELTTLGAHHTERSLFEWGLYIAGFLLTIGAMIYFGYKANRAMKKYESDESAEKKL